MKKRIPLFLLVIACLSVGAVRPPGPGQVVYVFETTDAQLIEEITTARHWQGVFDKAGDTTAAYFWSGVAYHAQQQLDELDRRIRN